MNSPHSARDVSIKQEEPEDISTKQEEPEDISIKQEEPEDISIKQEPEEHPHLTAQGDEDSLPPPPPTQDSSTFSLFDIPELQTLDNADVQQCELSDEQEEEEYVPVPRKVRRQDQANPQHQDMTPFQEAFVTAMAQPPKTVPQALDANYHFFMSMAKMVDGLPVRGQALLRMKMLQAVNAQLFEELGEQAP